MQNSLYKNENHVCRSFITKKLYKNVKQNKIKIKKSLMRSVTFSEFIDEIFALCFEWL